MILSPLQAQLIEICVSQDTPYAAGDVLFILEAMKMEHEIRASHAGQLSHILCEVGQWLQQHEVLAYCQAEVSPSLTSSQANANPVVQHPVPQASIKANSFSDKSRDDNVQSNPHSDITSLPIDSTKDLFIDSSNTPIPSQSSQSSQTSLSHQAHLTPVSASSQFTHQTPIQQVHQQLAQAAVELNQVLGRSNLRADLHQLHIRQAMLQDNARPQAVEKRWATGRRSARQNIADLSDVNFTEYGAFAIAAQTARRPVDELIAQTPADGLITGIATVNADYFEESKSKVAVMAYDATVLAGTQGFRNHQKTDRILDIADSHHLPLILFAEGGGGRPGDVDVPVVAGLHVASFAKMAALNGKVPLIGIAAGRCFAGNAALLGCCDVIIATQDSNIGMGGPVMIEGGGLGSFSPEQIGPSAVQHANGVIDVLVKDEAQAVLVAKQYLAFFQGPFKNWQEPNTAALRDFLPVLRSRSYASDKVLELIADPDSVLFLRTGFGHGIHTALGRIKGRAVGFMINNPLHLGGAIDPDAADKAARFMQLCNAHQLPIISLIDTPGFMVGPDVEARAQVRHTSRMFISAAHLRVPLIAIIMRKAYGLGAMSMTAGGFHMPVATLAWPSAECGGMGIEGAVRLGYKKELEALPEGPQRQDLFDKLVAQAIEKGSALSMAMHLEIDDVIDPAHTRQAIFDLLLASKIKPLPSHATSMIDAF